MVCSVLPSQKLRFHIFTDCACTLSCSRIFCHRNDPYRVYGSCLQVSTVEMMRLLFNRAELVTVAMAVKCAIHTDERVSVISQITLNFVQKSHNNMQKSFLSVRILQNINER